MTRLLCQPAPVLLIAAAAFTISAESSLRGLVVDTERKAVSGAVATLTNTHTSDTTDTAGAFSLLVEPANAPTRLNKTANATVSVVGGRVHLRLPGASHFVRIELFDISGRRVATVLNSVLSRGSYNIDARRRMPAYLTAITRVSIDGASNCYRLGGGPTASSSTSAGNGEEAAPSLRRGTSRSLGAAFVDTLVVRKSGYHTVRIPVMQYDLDLDTITMPDTSHLYIVASPTSLSVTDRDSLSLCMRVEGPGPLHYLWLRGDSTVSESDLNCYALNPVSLGDSGTYRVVAASPNDTVTSPAFGLTVLPIPITIVPMRDTVIGPHDTAYIHVSARSAYGRIVTYQWRFADRTGVDSTADSVYLASWFVKDTGLHICHVQVTDEAGYTSASVPCSVSVLPFAPRVWVRDTNFYFNDTRLVFAHASDTNGVVQKYYWSVGGGTWSATDSNHFALPGSGYGLYNVAVKVQDDDSVFSAVDTMVVGCFPCFVYGPTDYTYRYALLQNSAGAIMLTGGRTVGLPLPDNSLASVAQLMEIDTDGQLRWCRYYALNTKTRSTGIAAAAAGGFLIAGVATATSAPSTMLLATNAAGDSLWSKTNIFGYFSLGSAFSSVTRTPSGDFVASGYQSPGMWTEGTLLCVNGSGDSLWSQVLPASDSVYGDADALPDGNLLLYGKGVALLSSRGSVIWKNLLPSQETAHAIPSGDGGFYALSDSGSTIGSFYLGLTKLDASGRIAFARRYRFQYWTQGCSILHGNGDTLILVAYGGDEWEPNRRGILIGVDPNGTVLWQKSFVEFSFYRGLRLAEEAIVCAGYTNVTGLAMKEVALTKFDLSGNRIW